MRTIVIKHRNTGNPAKETVFKDSHTIQHTLEYKPGWVIVNVSILSSMGSMSRQHSFPLDTVEEVQQS